MGKNTIITTTSNLEAKPKRQDRDQCKHRNGLAQRQHNLKDRPKAARKGHADSNGQTKADAKDQTCSDLDRCRQGRG